MSNYSQDQEQDDSRSEPRVYSKEELIYLAKLYERAERHEEAVNFIYDYIKAKPIMNSDERLCFSNCFKNLLSIKRSSLKYLVTLEKKEKKDSANRGYAQEIIKAVEEEYNEIINLMHDILDNYLIPNSKKAEAQVFYMKLKADYYRYKAEYAKGEDLEAAIDMAEQAYNEAYMLAEDELPITSINRVGLSLNFSLFYYEQKNMIDEAIVIARNCFDDAIKVVDDIDADKAKDYILLVQLLKENSIFWSTEKADEEEAS